MIRTLPEEEYRIQKTSRRRPSRANAGRGSGETARKASDLRTEQSGKPMRTSSGRRVTRQTRVPVERYQKNNRREEEPGRASGKARGFGQEGITVDEGNLEAARTKSRMKVSSMNFRTVAVMLILIGAMTSVLIYYIKLQTDLSSSSSRISELEQELTEMKAENDAAYNEINDRISLDEVRDKAIHELGMKYADKNQVVIYSASEEDGAHQVSGGN